MRKPIALIFPVLLLLAMACICSSNGENGTPEPAATEVPYHPDTEEPSGDEQIGTIRLERDMVEHGLLGGALEQLIGTDPLFDGDSLRLFEGGESVLDFGDSIQLRLFNDTELQEIHRTSAEGTPLGVQIYLALGGFTGRVMEEGSQATIRTPGGTRITVYGTDFYVIYNPAEGMTSVGNFEGSLEVESQNLTLSVPEGYFRNIPDGEEPRGEQPLPVNIFEFEERAREYLSPVEAAASFGGQVSIITVPPIPVETAPPSGPEVLYDFVESADTAQWSSRMRSELPFPGEVDEIGFAYWFDGYLEDGRYVERALHTHPSWQDYGWIQGLYSGTDYILIQPGDYLYIEPGFIESAEGGEVTFVVYYSPADRCFFGEEFPRELMVSEESFDGEIPEMRVKLADLAGQSGCFLLRVNAGPSSGRDWAVWATAQLLRP